jgi:hypothetical protein
MIFYRLLRNWQEGIRLESKIIRQNLTAETLKEIAVKDVLHMDRNQIPLRTPQMKMTTAGSHKYIKQEHN